jgi:hypothetical protein
LAFHAKYLSIVAALYDVCDGGLDDGDVGC